MSDPTNGVPSVIEQGNSYSFLLDYADYPTGTYGLTFSIQSGHAAPKNIAATVSSGKFLVTLTTTITEDLPVGEASYAAYATASGVRKTAESGKLQVAWNLSRARPKSYAQLRLEHWQGEYSRMTSRLQNASSISQNTSHQLAKVRDEIQHWEAVVKLESDKEEIARIYETV